MYNRRHAYFVWARGAALIAVILIGGQGTRLRPLTCRTPKPLLPVVNKPFLNYQFEVLKKHGIREVVLCTGYRAESFERALGGGRAHGLKLRFVREAAPLGTGGALKNAEDALAGRGTFLVLNGDVLNAFALDRFLAFHRRKRSLATIALTRAVSDPTVYGLVKTAKDGRIEEFLEKPSWDEVVSDTISAGAYLFEPSVLDLIPAGRTFSLERTLFPLLLRNAGRFYGFETGGYWIDIGSMDRYLQVHLDILGGRTPFQPEASRQSVDGGRVAVGAGARVAPLARFAGNVCVGARCRIGKARLSDCVVLEGARIEDGARLTRCVIGPGCAVGACAEVGPGAVLGAGSRVSAYSQV